MSYHTSPRGRSSYGLNRPAPRWQSSHRRNGQYAQYPGTEASPASSVAKRPTSSSTSKGQIWSSSSTSNYSAVYDADTASSSRTAGKLRNNTFRTGAAKGESSGLRSKDFSYAFIGKETERYAQEALGQQIDYSISNDLMTAGDSIAASPRIASSFKPGLIVEEFKREGHYQAARSQLLTTFATSEYKDFLMNSLEEYLLKRIANLKPEERQKLSTQPSRVQEMEISKWIDEADESAEIFDELFEKMRNENEDETGLFQEKGVVGKIIADGIADVIQNETHLLERKKLDTSDEDDGSPSHKGDLTPAQEHPHQGNQTPNSVAALE